MSTADDKRFAAYRNGYTELWKECDILPSRRGDVERTVARILANKFRYTGIERETGVPWWVVAIVHKMEANLSFESHLHNGDSLARRTWQVPKGRPTSHAGPFTWEESAIDAIRYDGLDKIKEWSLERTAYAFEKFNGFGYRKYGVPSPYLWSYTNRYARGKFVRDGIYDPQAVSKQSGAMAILKVLMQRDSSVVVHARDAVPLTPDENEMLPRAQDRKLSESRTLFGGALAAGGWLVSKASEFFDWLGDGMKSTLGLITEATSEADGVVATVTPLMTLLGQSLPWLGAAAALYGIFIVFGARISAHINKKVG